MVEYKRAEKDHTKIISRMVADTSPEFYGFLLSESNIDIYDYSLIVSMTTNIERYTDVAIVDGTVAGMCFSYNSKFHAVNDAMRDTFSERILEGLKECYANVIEDSLFLDSIYVEEAHRRKGIAAELLKRTFRKAEKQCLKGVSLFTLFKNVKAVNLYKKSGFSVMNTFELVPGEMAYLFFKEI